MFKLLDKNGDGVITLQEFKERFEPAEEAEEEKLNGGVCKNDEMWRGIMAKVDKDRCGEVKWDEFKQGMRLVISEKVDAVYDKPLVGRKKRKPNTMQ